MTDQWIFRLCMPEEWTAFQSNGVYSGNVNDKKDGFVHFSAASQVQKTATCHYPAEGQLILLAVEASVLGKDLVWEASRDGALFPHVYGTVPLSAVKAWRCLECRVFDFFDTQFQLTEAEGWTCIP